MGNYHTHKHKHTHTQTQTQKHVSLVYSAGRKNWCAFPNWTHSRQFLPATGHMLKHCWHCSHVYKAILPERNIPICMRTMQLFQALAHTNIHPYICTNSWIRQTQMTKPWAYIYSSVLVGQQQGSAFPLQLDHFNARTMFFSINFIAMVIQKKALARPKRCWWVL